MSISTLSYHFYHFYRFLEQAMAALQPDIEAAGSGWLSGKATTGAALAKSYFARFDKVAASPPQNTTRRQLNGAMHLFSCLWANWDVAVLFQHGLCIVRSRPLARPPCCPPPPPLAPPLLGRAEHCSPGA